MSEGTQQISSLESFQVAIDRCCDAQVECVTQLAKATCDVWSKVLVCYVDGVTKGFRSVMKCYIAGVECFSNTLETVAEELCGKTGKLSQAQFCKTLETVEEDPGDKKAKEAKAEFYKTFYKTLETVFKTVETVAENVGHKHGKLSKAEFYMAMQTFVEEMGTKNVAEFSKLLETVAENVGDKKAKEAKAESSQRSSAKSPKKAPAKK